jgi:23S rRNA pseudouridine955/2504/2580 synthase/23S rRNA pseudouridine1911/1915/1917 synthase
MKEQWCVSAEEAGMPLLSFLRKKNPDAPSVKSLKRAIDGKCCIVNGQIEIFSSHPLKKNDRVLLQKQEEKRQALTLLYTDADLLIVDKPAGLTCEDRFFAPRLPTRAQLIHRLDKETSGLVMLGKNRDILDAMIALFRAKGVHKEYLALVDGKLQEAEGTIHNHMRKKPSQPGQAFYIAGRSGMEAITRYRRLKVGKDASLVLCEPITGRTHQLRVHMNGLGHPILGDMHYGLTFRCPLHPQRHLLHASALSFIHPLTHENIHVTSPLPTDFEDVCRRLNLSC